MVKTTDTLGTLVGNATLGSILSHSRYSLTSQFVVGALLFAKDAKELEATVPEFDELTQRRHESWVLSAIMHSSAALETEVWEIMTYGAMHLTEEGGANRVLGPPFDSDCETMKNELREAIDRKPTVERWQTLLQILCGSRFCEGSAPFQDAKLLGKIRNALIHYKSEWDDESFLKGIRSKNFTPVPCLVKYANSGFFPKILFNSDCARWAATTVVAFLDEAYNLLGLPLGLFANHRKETSEYSGIMP